MIAIAETSAGRPRAPWHYWLLTLLSLPWNGFGAFDYSMSHLQGEPYYRAAGMSDTQIALMASYPSWMHVVWAIGVWGSLLGSLLLLFRSKWAVQAFSVSILGAIGNFAYTALNPEIAEAMGLAMPMVIIAACAFFVWYARTMAKRRVLR